MGFLEWLFPKKEPLRVGSMVRYGGTKAVVTRIYIHESGIQVVDLNVPNKLLPINLTAIPGSQIRR